MIMIMMLWYEWFWDAICFSDLYLCFRETKGCDISTSWDFVYVAAVVASFGPAVYNYMPPHVVREICLADSKLVFSSS
jgi:hypothetical protein